MVHDDIPGACPPDDVLGALAHRLLEPDEVERVTAYLDACPACQEVMIGAVRAGVATPQDVTLTGQEGPAVRRRVAPGAQLGRYELRGLLGVGGMGAVYDARDTELDRAVALKVLRTGLRDAPGLAERLVRESRLMAKVADPSVITVYDVGRDGDIVFIAMELIRGSTLTAWLASHPLGWRGVVALFERAGHGLAAAHGAGIVHRDFKPDNVLVARGGEQVVVTDFGIAREVVGAVRDTAEGAAGDEVASSVSRSAAFGTPAYMAPEQVVGEPADHRADIFAFSVSLWEALFRERPFPGRTIAEIRAAMQRPLVFPTAARVPSRLQRALRVGLAIDPRARWSDMRTLLTELAAVRAPRRWIAGTAAAAALVGVGIAAALVATPSAPAVDLCGRALASLHAAYNPRIADQVRAALASDPKVQEQVMAKLDGVAAAWRTTQSSTCQAEREVSQDPTTTACLDARLQELAGTAEQLIANGAGGVKYAARLAGFVGQPAACAAPAAGLLFARVPTERPVRQAVSALRGRHRRCARRAQPLRLHGGARAGRVRRRRRCGDVAAGRRGGAVPAGRRPVALR